MTILKPDYRHLHPTQIGKDHPIYSVRINNELSLLVRWRALPLGGLQPYMRDSEGREYAMWPAYPDVMRWAVYRERGNTLGYVLRCGDYIAEWVDPPADVVDA